MTLQDYLRVFRRRWPIIVVCALAASAVMWFITPADAGAAKETTSYTATATLLVGSKGKSEQEPSAVSMGRIALYLTNGDIPRRAAKALDYEGNPALLASGLTVETDPTAMAVTVAASAPDGNRAAAVANAFADEAVTYFKKSRPGAENVEIAILQEATPIPDESGGGIAAPGRVARTLIAGFLGLLLGLGLAILLDRVDSRLRTRADIQEALRMPVIAEVPKMSRALRRRGAIVTEDPLSVYADGYRAARTALVHTGSRQLPGEYTPRRSADPALTVTGAQLVLVTSAFPGEGKSTSAANLAASFAETGQRVLVLDADLRSPDAHNHFDVPQGAGISDYLSSHGETELDALVRPTSIPGVRIITAGTSLTNPASLSSRMGHLLSEARERADVVLIDSAPLLAASDVFDILPLADTVLLVVRSGRLTVAAGHRVSELLGRFQVPVSGALIVGAKLQRRRAGYGYGYGYGSGKKKRSRTVAAPQESVPLDAEVFGEGQEPVSRRARRSA